MVKQLAAKPPLRPKPWVRGKGRLELVKPEPQKITIKPQSFVEIARELPPLFERHWKELGSHKDTIPLEPDWDRYFALCATGVLHVMTARCGDILAGYIFNLVGPHLHYRSTIHAEIEMFWLDEPYRGGLFAKKWFEANERYLKTLNVKRVSVAVKNGYKDGRAGLIFKRMGYLPVETNWSRVL